MNVTDAFGQVYLYRRNARAHIPPKRSNLSGPVRNAAHSRQILLPVRVGRWRWLLDRHSTPHDDTHAPQAKGGQGNLDESP